MNKKIGLFVVLAVISPGLSAWAQQPQSVPWFTPAYPNLLEVHWETVSGRTYFMQSALDLSLWNYCPDIEYGDGLPIEWTVSVEGDHAFFFRLQFTDEPTTDPDLEDFDGDGIPSLVEVAIMGSDPLVANAPVDSDNDGLPDAWELHFFGNLTTQTGTGDADSDGLTNREEFDLALDPSAAESASASLRTGFTYDAAGRLTNINSPEFSTTFTIDEEGNILSAQ